MGFFIAGIAQISHTHTRAHTHTHTHTHTQDGYQGRDLCHVCYDTLFDQG